jgi:hypothetical protein
MQMGYLTLYGLTYPEVSSDFTLGSFCLLVCNHISVTVSSGMEKMPPQTRLFRD